MGQRNGFSESDVEKLNRMYDCGYVSAPGAAAPAPAPAPGVPAPAPVVPGGNPIVDSFLSGLISGLGLGEEEKPTEGSS